jgi:hypothetical protein
MCKTLLLKDGRIEPAFGSFHLKFARYGKKI